MSLKLVYASFLLALTSMSLLFVWPIYQDVYLLATAFGALLTGFAIGAYQQRRSASLVTTVMLTLFAFIALALPLANPRALTNPGSMFDGFLEAVRAPIESWKQIITIDLPLGTYHALLAPVLVLYLLTGLLFGWLIFGKIASYWLAAFPVLAVVIFAIGFGVTSVPGDFSVLGLSLPFSTSLVSGTGLFVLLVIYLNWGARATRREKLMVGKDSLGLTRNLLFRKLRRFSLAAVVLTIVVTLVGTTMELGGVPNSRTVLRSGVEKLRVLQQQTSPLSTYRKFFSDPELLQRELISYTTQGAPSRIRIATMPYFNGETFTVSPTSGSTLDDNVFFARVPSEVPTSGNGIPKFFDLSVGKLDAIWLPVATNVKRITFLGNNSAQLTDSLFLNRVTNTAAIIPGSSENANYRLEYLSEPQVQAEDITPGTATIDESFIPDSLKTWLAAQPDVTINDGTGMVAITKRLRDRGFLSHALTEPEVTETQTVSWVTAVDGLEFQQSTAGHNVSRIDQLFKDLNSQQERVGKRGNLVATAGDDEQFATAIALIATAKGFPARVVVGFRTGQAEDVPGVPSCAETATSGLCTGANLSAWAEIQGTNGQWLALDATPQFEKQLTLVPPPPGTPKNPTEAGEDSAVVLPPGKSVPSTDSNCLKNPEKCKTPPKPLWDQIWEFFLTYLLPAIQVVSILSVFAGPFALIVLMKRRRRRSRQQHPSEFAQIVGAWEEYVDTSLDFGAAMPRNRTRIELARDSANPEVMELAELANEMAYGSSDFESVERTEEEIRELASKSWAILEAERARLRTQTNRTGKLRALFSLRSFIRQAKPKEQLQALSSKLRFSQTNRVSDGSGVAGLIQLVLRQLRSLGTKK